MPKSRPAPRFLGGRLRRPGQHSTTGPQASGYPRQHIHRSPDMSADRITIVIAIIGTVIALGVLIVPSLRDLQGGGRYWGTRQRRGKQ